MVFPQLPSYNVSQENPPPSQQGGLDSISLGQLKAMVGSAPKPKVRPFRSSFLTPRRLTLGSK